MSFNNPLISDATTNSQAMSICNQQHASAYYAFGYRNQGANGWSWLISNNSIWNYIAVGDMRAVWTGPTQVARQHVGWAWLGSSAVQKDTLLHAGLAESEPR